MAVYVLIFVFPVSSFFSSLPFSLLREEKRKEGTRHKRREEKRTGQTRLTSPVADRERNAEQETGRKSKVRKLTAPNEKNKTKNTHTHRTHSTAQCTQGKKRT